MFKRAYLHIGLGKTGTSAVQAQLLQHAGRLEREQDMHFPRLLDSSGPFDGNHSQYLNAMFVDETGLGRSHKVAGFKSRETLALHAAGLRRQFEQGFAASGASQLLLSAEVIGHFSQSRLLLLAGWLQQFAREVEIIACIRHPLDALSSEIQQRLKQGFVLEDMYETPPCYKFSELFGRLEAAFPHSAFRLYDFSEALVFEGGVAGAFLRQLGVDLDLAVPAAKPANPSMSHEAALLLSALNRARPLLDSGGRNSYRSPNDVMELIQIPGRKFQAPAEVHEKLGRLIAGDLQWLRDKYGIELHARPVSQELDYRHFSEESIEDIALRVAELSKLRYDLVAPVRSVAVYARTLWSNVKRKVK